jgi:hypothetical protein
MVCLSSRRSARRSSRGNRSPGGWRLSHPSILTGFQLERLQLGHLLVNLEITIRIKHLSIHHKIHQNHILQQQTACTKAEKRFQKNRAQCLEFRCFSCEKLVQFQINHLMQLFSFSRRYFINQSNKKNFFRAASK